VCRGLLSGLEERGVDASGGILLVIDGGKAIAKAVRDVFGSNAGAAVECRGVRRRIRKRGSGGGFRRFRLVAVPAVFVVLASCASNAPQDSLKPAGPFARQIDHLFFPVFWLAVVPIFLLVQGLIIVTVVRHRHRPGRPDPVQVHGNTKLEIAWTVLPALILVVAAVPTVLTIFDLSHEPKGGVLPVDVYGHSWWWEYRYPTLGLSTANELHIPTGRPVRLSLRTIEPGLPAAKGEEFAQGVIHSFWVPRLAGKQDVVPGRVNKLTIEADKAGVYKGQCAEYCNLSHANMRLRVVSQEPADFARWVDEQKQPITKPTSGDAAAGFAVFTGKGTCVGCHTLQGVEGAVARVGPNLTHLQSRETFAGATFDLTPDNLRRWLRDPSAMKPMRPERGLGMPNLHLSEQEITQLVAFLETLR
jgi:cytochrome c oxidase subunit 2